jgi:N-dimethylarginine dimethylaminohydrolase
VVGSAQYPRTLDRLQRVASVMAIDSTELAKAEGGVTCCSILL